VETGQLWFDIAPECDAAYTPARDDAPGAPEKDVPKCSVVQKIELGFGMDAEREFPTAPDRG